MVTASRSATGSTLKTTAALFVAFWKPVSWVKPGCHLLIRYMALLFVPISVGVMEKMVSVISCGLFSSVVSDTD